MTFQSYCLGAIAITVFAMVCTSCVSQSARDLSIDGMLSGRNGSLSEPPPHVGSQIAYDDRPHAGNGGGNSEWPLALSGPTASSFSRASRPAFKSRGKSTAPTSSSSSAIDDSLDDASRFSIPSTALPDRHYVEGHMRDGRWVEGHYQTNPDGTTANNWSTSGNLNPITGTPGTQSPFSSSSGSVSVRGYTRSDGTYVSGYTRKR